MCTLHVMHQQISSHHKMWGMGGVKRYGPCAADMQHGQQLLGSSPAQPGKQAARGHIVCCSAEACRVHPAKPCGWSLEAASQPCKPCPRQAAVTQSQALDAAGKDSQRRKLKLHAQPACSLVQGKNHASSACLSAQLASWPPGLEVLMELNSQACCYASISGTSTGSKGLSPHKAGPQLCLW